MVIFQLFAFFIYIWSVKNTFLFYIFLTLLLRLKLCNSDFFCTFTEPREATTYF